MIKKEDVIAIVEESLVDTEVFLVDVNVHPGNRIVVELDSESPIAIDFCVKTTRYVESKLDREVEDYELEVGSFGLTEPFKLVRQYEKNVGNDVEVLTKDGRKLYGVLTAANEETFEIEVESMQKPEGAKRKVLVVEHHTFQYVEVKYTKYLIRFK